MNNESLETYPHKHQLLDEIVVQNFQLMQKVKDPEAFKRRVEQNKKFNAWCETKGYFPHTKYFEAWMAGQDQ